MTVVDVVCPTCQTKLEVAVPEVASSDLAAAAETIVQEIWPKDRPATEPTNGQTGVTP